MSNTTVIEYCELLKTKIQDIASGYNVVSSLVTDLSLNGINKKICVHPQNIERSFETRASVQKNIVIEANIIHKSKSLSELEQVIEKQEEIQDSVIGYRIGNGVIMRQDSNPLYTLDDIEQKNIVQSIITFNITEFVK